MRPMTVAITDENKDADENSANILKRTINILSDINSVHRDVTHSQRSTLVLSL